MALEPIEPRLLLNADIPGLDLMLVDDENRDQQVLVRMIEEAGTGTEAGQVIHRLQVVDQANADEVLADERLNDVTKLRLELGGGDDLVTIDAASFGDRVLPLILVDGGEGDDRLAFHAADATDWRLESDGYGEIALPRPVAFYGFETLQGGDQDDTFTVRPGAGTPGLIDGAGGEDRLVLETTTPTTWMISGAGAGDVVVGTSSLSFAGMENLTGADDVDDTFVVTAGGELAGIADGGAGGIDRLEVQGSYRSVTATLDGATTILDLDGKRVSFAGLDQSLVNDNNLQLVVLGTTGDDHVVLEDGAGVGSFQIRSTNDSFATQTFSNSVLTVVLGLSTGNDSFSATLTEDNPFVGNVIIAETANLTLGDVRGIDGSLSVETFSTVNQAAPGELDYDGSSILVKDGAEIDITGDLSLVVNANDVLDASNLQGWISVPIIKGAISIGDRASISARDVVAEVKTTNERQIFLSIDADALLDMALEDARVAGASGWGSLALADNGNGTATFTRASGNWADDGFAAGQDLLLLDQGSELNQSFRIQSLNGMEAVVALDAGTTLPGASLSEAPGVVIGGYAFTRMTGTDRIIFGLVDDGAGAINPAILRAVPVANPDAELVNAAGVTFESVDGVIDTIRRSAGSWSDDGFAVGQTIEIDGNGVNNGTYLIDAINGLDLTLTEALAEAGTALTGLTIRGHMLGSFQDDGFQAGDLIAVQGSGDNDTSFRVAEVNDRVLVLEASTGITGQEIDLTAADAPALVIQKANENVALENLPLVLLDADGNAITAEDGTPLSFTQAELDAAQASQNQVRIGDSDSTLAEDVLSYLVDNPLTDFLTEFGLRIIASTVSSNLTLGTGSTITADGDVTLRAQTTSEVDGSTPSVVGGLSVVYSKASADITVKQGTSIAAAGAVLLDASTAHSVTADASVTSGTIVNPAQGAVDDLASDTFEGTLGLAADIFDRTLDQVNPAFGTAFGFLQGQVPAMTGFVRVPGPAIAVAVGVADTDTTITIEAGSSLSGSAISVLTNVEDYDPSEDTSVDRFTAITNSYGVSAGATIFQPGKNQGFGISAAFSITQSDAMIDIAGDLKTHSGSDGDIVIAAASVNDANSVSAASWVRESPQGVGGLGALLSGFPTAFSDRVGQIQGELRNQQALNSLLNENPGAVSLAAGIAFLISHNNAEIKISSGAQNPVDGGVRADGSLSVATLAIENPSVGAAGASEPGAETDISGGVAFARYVNKAQSKLLDGAVLTAKGNIDATADAIIPNQITFDELFYQDIKDAGDTFNEETAAANQIQDEDARDAALQQAQEKYTAAMASAVEALVNFPLDLVKNRFWGLGGLEGFLFTSYVNSGGGGTYASNNPNDQVSVIDKNTGKVALDRNGNPRTKAADTATQEAGLAIAGNINILNFENTATVDIGAYVTVAAGESLTAASNAEMESINLTGLTSLWDIVWNTVSKFTDRFDDPLDDSSGADGGYGANIGLRVFTNKALTTVNGGSQLEATAGDVAVLANTRDLHVNLHEIGASGGEVAVSGSISVDVVNNETRAQVDESVAITADGDVELEADSDLLQVNVVLAGAESEADAGQSSTAVGAAIGVNVVISVTEAGFADLDETPTAIDPAAWNDPDQARVQAGGDVRIEATRSEIFSQTALAGALKSSGAPGDGGGQGGGGGGQPDGIFSQLSGMLNRSDPNGLFQENWQANSPGSTLTPPDTQAPDAFDRNSNGIAAAGSVLVDVSDATVKATIAAGTSINAAGAVRVLAGYERDLVMVDGGFVLDSSTTSDRGALAGAFGVGVASRTVEADVTGAIIHADALEVSAKRRDLAVAISAGGAGALRGEVAISGSVNVEVFENTVTAKVTNSHVDVDGDAAITAEADTLLVSIAGALGAVGEGKAGVGAAVGVSSHVDTVHAHLDDTTLNAGGDVTVKAHNDLDVISVVASLGASATGNGGSGQFSLHLISNDVEARIGEGSQVTAENNVAVLAADAITLVTVTGGVAIGGKSAFGVAFSSSNIYDRKVKALIADGASVTSRANGATTSFTDLPDGTATVDGVLVKAVADDDVINVVVGASIAGSRFAGQGSILVDTNVSEVSARIGTGEGASTKYAQVTVENGGGVSVDADHDLVHVGVVGGVAAGLAGSAFGASAHVVVHHRTVEATIGAFAQVTADDSVLVAADLDAVLRSIVFTGAFAASGAAFGGALTVNVFNDFVTAQAMREARVISHDGNVGIAADHQLGLTLVDVAVAASGKAGISASIGIAVQNATTKALVGSAAEIMAGDTVLVDAVGIAEIQNIVGGAAVGGKAGVGASGFVLVRRDEVKADIGNGASVTGLAIGDGLQRDSYLPDASETLSGVAVIAESRESLVGVAVQGSVSGTTAVSGSLPISAITELTYARIGVGAQINMPAQQQPIPEDDQNVVVRAVDDTLVVHVAGNVAISGQASVGVGADILSIVKDTFARIGVQENDTEESDQNPAPAPVTTATQVRATGNVLVVAEATDKLVSVVIGVAGASKAAVALNASIYVHDSDTIARVGPLADVRAEGSVVVDAFQATDADLIVLSAAGSGVAAVNGGAGVAVFNRTTEAIVDTGAEVTALGLRDGLIDIRTGLVIEESRPAGTALSVGSQGVSTQDSAFADIGRDFDLGLPNFINPVADEEQDGDTLFAPQSFRAQRFSDVSGAPSFRGVSITATNVDDVTAFTGALTGGGVAIGGGAVVTVMTAGTRALVESGARINGHDGTPGAAQSVQIGAGSAFDTLGIVAAAGGGGFALLPVAHVVVADLTTEARINAERVAAAGDISLRASAHEDIQSLGIVLALGGSAALAPAISVIDLSATTLATVGASSLLAGGNVLVAAEAATNIDALQVAIGGSAGAGVGAAVGVVTVNKTTEAVISAEASVTALATGSTTLSALSGEGVDAEDDRENVKGLVVEAVSSENIDVIAAGVGAGSLAIGGSVAVQYIDSDTRAAIEPGAKINTPVTGTVPGEDQSVSVGALNSLDLFVVAGGVAIGGGISAAAGINIADVKNDTVAYLGGTVNAKDRLSVAALSDQRLEGVIFSGAGGAVALGAAVGVYRIGQDLDMADDGASYPSPEDPGDPGQNQSAFKPGPGGAGPLATTQNATADSSQTLVAGLQAGLSSGSQSDDQLIVGGAAAAVAGATASAPPPAEVPIEAGTTAFIAQNSSIQAGGAIDIDARQASHIDVIVGGVAFGILGASGGIGIVETDNDVTAKIAQGAVITQGGDISVSAALDQTMDLTAFAGAGSAFGSLSAGVAVINDKGDVRAVIEDEVQIIAAGTVTVDAASEVVLRPNAIAISVALLGVAGAGAVIDLTASGETSATVGDDVAIGVGNVPGMAQGMEPGVEGVSVSAVGTLLVEDDTATNGMVIGGSGGILAGAGGVIEVRDQRNILATLGEGADIHASGEVSIAAISGSSLEAITFGGAAGVIGGGVMISNITVATRTAAEVKGQENQRSMLRAGSLAVRSFAQSYSYAEAEVVSVGLLAGGRESGASVDVTATSAATIGDNVDVRTTGGIEVLAQSAIEADTLTKAGGGGFIDVGFAKSTTNINANRTPLSAPTTLASVGAGSVLIAGGDISIQAAYDVDATPYDPEIASIDPDADTITLSNQTGLATGDRVQYSGGEAAALGLEEGRDYAVIEVDAQSIQFGQLFNLGFDDSEDNPERVGVDTVFDVIRFDQPHGFEDGDRVRFSASDPVSLKASEEDLAAGRLLFAGHGLETGDVIVLQRRGGEEGAFQEETFYVIAREPLDPEDLDDVNRNTIWLAATPEDAEAGTVTSLLDDTPEAYALSVEQPRALTFDAPSPLRFDLAAFDPENDRVTAAGHGLATGDRVGVRVSGTASDDTVTLFAIRVSADVFALAASAEDAEGAEALDLLQEPTGELRLNDGTNDLFVADPGAVEFVITRLPPSEVLTVNGHGFETGDAVSVRAAGGESVDLYAIRVDDDRFSLAATMAQAEADEALTFGVEASTGGIAFFDGDTAVLVADQDATGFSVSRIMPEFADPLSLARADLADAEIALESHGLRTGDAVRLGLADPDATATRYFVIAVDDDTIAFARSASDAEAGVRADFLSDERIISYAATPRPDFALEDGVSYTVKVIDEVTIKLVSDDLTLNTATFDSRDVLEDGTFALVDHGFTNGDAVTYDGPAAFSISREALELTLKFGDHDDDPDTDDKLGFFFEDGTNALVLPGYAPSVHGTQLVYRGGETQSVDFQPAAVDFEPNDFTIFQDLDGDTNRILIDDHGLRSGEKLIYRVGSEQDAEAIGGLVDGGTYYVVAVSPDAIMLTLTREAALGIDATLSGLIPNYAGRIDLTSAGSGTHAFDFVETIGNLVDGDTYTLRQTLIFGDTRSYELVDANNRVATLDRDDLDTGEAHTFFQPGDYPILELIDRQTYYVVEATADTFRLALTPDGPALDLPDPVESGQQTLAVMGLDFLTAGFGAASLVIDLQQDGGGTLLGEGGEELFEQVSFGGDGKSSAEARGFSLSALAGSANTAKVTVKPTVTVAIGDAAELTSTGGDITLKADSVSASLAKANTFGISLLVGSKESDAGVDVNSLTTLAIADDALLRAAADIVLHGTADHRGDAESRAEGGGFVSLDFSYAGATVTEKNRISIGNDAVLMAGGTLDISGLTSGKARGDAWISNGGLGARAVANSGEDGGRFTATTEVTIGENAELTADRLQVQVQGTGITTVGRADLTTGGLGTNGDATAPSILTSTSTLDIAAGAQLTGNFGVVLRALNGGAEHRNGAPAGNIAISTAIARNRALAGDTDSTARATLDLNATVTAAATATVFAGPGGTAQAPTAALRVEADAPFDDSGTPVPMNSNQRFASATSQRGVFDWGTESTPGTTTRTSNIDWDADVVIHAGLKPRLVVDEDGEIVEAVNVTVNDGDSSGNVGDKAFFVDDIAPTQYGWIEFRAEGLIEMIGGSEGTFYLLDTLSEVYLENNSDAAMTVHNIDVQMTADKTRPDVIIDVDGLSNTLEFNVGEAALPTRVEIRNLGADDLIVGGTINNPRGETILFNQGGDILAGAVRGVGLDGTTVAGDEITRRSLVISNAVDIDAVAGSIGTSAGGFNVDLVSLVVLAPADIGTPGAAQWREATLEADAGGNAFLDLKARSRLFAPDALGSGALSQTVGHVQAGGEVGIDLRIGEHELYTPASGLVEVEARKDTDVFDAFSGYVQTHYKDDLGEDDLNGDTPPDRQAGDRFVSLQQTDTTYAFFGDEGESVPGIIAGGDIEIRQRDPIGLADDPGVSIHGLVDAGSQGVLDALAAGFVTLTELSDDMNVGRIESRYHNVILTARTGSILDAFEDADADVLGGAINLRADQGRIGDKGEGPDGYRSLDLDSRLQGGAAGVIAEARGDIYLIETDGDIGVIRVASETGNVRIEAADGGVVVAGGEATQVEGTDIDLIAQAGSIGAVGTPLHIDSSFSGSGRLYALASGGIYLTETADQLNLLGAVSQTGDVVLRTPDTGATPLDGEGLGESLVFLTSGTTLLDAAVDHARVESARDVTLLVGDDVTMQLNSVIESGRSVAIYGDHGEADAGFGTTMLLRGEIMPTDSYIGWSAEIFGEGDADRFVLEDLFLGGATRVSGAGNEDLFMVQRLASMTTPLASDPDGSVSGYALTLDGQSGSDAYAIHTAGSQVQDADGYRDYVISVLDSGAPTDGSDVLDIYGVDADASQDGSDTFLMRRLAAIPGEPDADQPGMVALLHGTPEQATLTAGRPTEVERIHYDRNVNGRLTVHGLGGDDVFLSDDTTAVMTLDGGAGNDRFQIGQLFGSPRDTAAKIGATDVFGTTQTTVGWLSRGNGAALLVAGGAGDDDITVYSNKAALHLDGGDGNDAFTLRAFALTGEETRYIVNAPVSIDGGEGFDKVTTLGTERDDAFVITEKGLFGAGLSVSLLGAEELREIDGMEGDDTFFARSTLAATLTRVIGHLGSDTVNVTSDVTLPIVSASAEGTSSLITHRVAESGEDYAYASLPGLETVIADPASDAGLVVIEETGVGTTVGESGLVDSYTLRLARAPAAGETVYVTVSAARTGSDAPLADTVWLAEAEGGFTRTVTVKGDDQTRANRDLVFAFTADNWNEVQTVHVMAPDDTASEGTRTVMISHRVRSDDTNFDGMVVRNVAVTVLDNDRAQLVINELGTDGEADGSTRVLEGADGSAVSDRYDLSLSLAPAEGETVRVYLDHDEQVALSGEGVLFDEGRAYVEFTADDFDQPVRVTITAVDDWITDGTLVSRISHHIEANGLYADAALEVLDVEVVDDETPGLFITETGGGTRLIQDSLDAEGNPLGLGQSDSYSLRLTARPEANVNIDLVSDGLIVFLVDGQPADRITFTPENYAEAVTVEVVADPEANLLDDAQPLRGFANQPHDLNAMRGALEVIGGVFVTREFVTAGMLPGELNPELPERPVSDDPQDLTAIDTLNVFDDGVMSDRDGVLTAATLSGLGMGGDFTFGETAFGQASEVAGGITYGAAGAASEIEILNLLMGQGNDSLVIESTLLTDADHGGITTIHGGGNRYADVAPGETTPTVIGGDTIHVLGGGGVDSPLVIFGDTTDDGAFYAGDPATASSAPFGVGPALDYPLASPFRFAGNDVIDASALFAGLDAAALPAVGVSIHGGGGDDTILGSQAGDHLTGGAGDDTILGGGGIDHVYGDSSLNIDPVGRILTVVTGAEAGADEIEGGTGEDIIFGDHGVIAQTPGTVRLLTTGNVVSAATTDPENGADDVIRADEGHDWVFGGNGDDTIDGGAGDDILFGDLGYIDANLIVSSEIAIGGTDLILAGDGEDVVIGGARGDTLDGEADNDLIFGDAVRLESASDAVNPRFRSLLGDVIYDANGDVQVDTQQGFVNPDNVAVWSTWRIVDLFHDGSQSAGSFGDDYIAGGAGDDMLFGQLGDDVIQGDGSIRPALDTGIRVGAWRDANGLLVLTPSFDAVTDGDDYIEGNGGNDVIFGNLGQDDIVGGSSSLFSLVDPQQRPDGDDLIFGGSGNQLERNAIGDTSVYGHARDADVILGDNGNIYRIVHGDGSYRSFAHDGYTDGLPAEEQLKIVVRGYQLLDYTIGWSPEDIGGSDLIHGGMGDDLIHGMTGNDVLYGNGHDDDLIGGTGHDRLFGGSGEDGMLGDDGLLLTARNGVGEPLYGLSPTVQATIGLPGPFTGAVVDIEGRIKKTAVILNPETLQIGRLDGVDLATAPVEVIGYHDIMYGGLGDDWMHGGYGDDAMSGAEALAPFYYDTRPQTDTPPIGYDPVTGILEYYDPENPLAKIEGFLLNFETFDATGEIIEDGKDRLFGDTGNDWLVGGTGHDRLFGGAGDDYLQGDDYLDTNGGANTDADPAAWGDFLVGGAGRDVLIANSGYDRMFDWTGEYNSFLVPFSRFGLPTIYRVPSPQVVDFLTELADASGADTRLDAPHDEPALVTQRDPEWTDQTGAPRDPQPGNGRGLYDNPGGPEDDTDKVVTIDGSTPGGRAPLFFPDPDATGDALTVRESDLETGASALGAVQFSAVGGIEGIAFASDTGSISIEGLDADALDWAVSLDGRTLTASLAAGTDVLRIELLGGDSIAAGETGERSVVVTLLAAMPHADDPNVDVLRISGISVLAEDLTDGTLEATLAVVVIDDRPSVDIQPAEADDTPWFDGLMPGETISGTWQRRDGADGAVTSVSLDGTLHDLDTAIAVERDGVSLGQLTVNADGTWHFMADEGLSGETQINVTFGLVVTDSDGDRDTALHVIGIGGDLIPTPDPEPDPNPEPDPDPDTGGKANNGVGNGVDPQPPGNPPVNDDIPDSPGNPGNKGGPSQWDEVEQDFGDGMLTVDAGQAPQTPTSGGTARQVMVFDDVSGTFIEPSETLADSGEALPVENAIRLELGMEEEWIVVSRHDAARAEQAMLKDGVAHQKGGGRADRSRHV